MSTNSGYLVEYISTSGELMRGIVMHSEQLPELIKTNRYFIKLTDYGFCDILKDDKGNDKAVIKNKESVKIMGYIN